MNYKIIINEEKLKQFVNWLPDLLPNEQYYITLLARKKYYPESGLKADKGQLKRVTSTKERIIDKIRQLQIEEGAYFSDGVAVCQENLAVYITPNPRDLYLAGLKTIKDITDKVMKSDLQYNPQSVALNAIQTTTSRKLFFDLDIDFNTNDFETNIAKFKTDICNVLNRDCLTFVRTNGGLHCLINLQDIHSDYIKNWYQNVVKLACDEYEVTMNGDNVLPVVGCVQGKDFSPYFIE
ncbi:hypothetical protein SY27_14170 [Flavobacterium sp. 316]|uniref:hypothetical protein n=1 Tax=Flavobacterium sp. 316 TaxID=1603293 RepID=UPI0005DC0C35|nr:hypothetical protein [Flavobacterium sp. 316]KIX20273.1 hypothetical protein SY27_14170 [Flavobacterium sp. 316]